MRMPRCVFTIALVLLFSVPTLPQQTSPATQRDPQALLVLAQCSAAMGVIGPTETFVASGQIIRADSEATPGTIVVKSIGTDRVHHETTHPEGQQVTTRNRTKASSSYAGRVQKHAYWQTKYARPEHIPAALCSLDLTRPRMNAVYLGLESFGGVSVHHVQFFAPSENQLKQSDSLEPLISDFHLFVDAQSFVVVKTKTFAFSPDAIENRSEWETYYSDYRPVGGVLMPFHISNYIMGQKLWDISFTSIHRNVSLAPTEFE